MDPNDVSDLVYADETGVNLSMARTHARCARGERAVAYAPKRRAKNITVIGAMGIQGMILAEVLVGGMKKPNFIAFATALFALLKPGQVVVLDNLRSHHAEEVKAAAAAAKVRLVYLPPYSPEFNPIEEAWSKFKSWLRKMKARSADALKSAVEHGLDLITPSDVRGWTKHAGYPVAQHA